MTPPPIYPVPTLDHVVVNVRDRVDEAQALYTRLGFSLTPRGYHTLGSMNHLAIFGTEYLELIAAPTGSVTRGDILGWPEGLNGVVWGTEDSSTLHATLTELGVEASEPGQFSRPVELAGVVRDAVFRTVRLPKETTPAGRLYFCHHFTRDLVWRDEWRHHPNGVIGVAEIVIAARDPGRLGGLFRKMFGGRSVSVIAGGMRLAVGLTRLDVVTPAVLAQRFGTAAAAADGRDEYMAALVLRTRGLDRAASAIEVPAVAREAGRVVVPASAAMGVTVVFE